MLKINDVKMDIILQVEEDTSIQTVLNKFPLKQHGWEVLIICPKIFLQRFIGHMYDISHFTTPGMWEDLEEQIKKDSGYISFGMIIDGMRHYFNFIVTETENKKIDNPFKGEQTFKVGLKEIKI